ncbi:MAG: SURF1 family protein [Pseudomonadota bacterium]
MKPARPSAARVLTGSCLLLAIAALLALGTWQVQRLAWKRALIAQVAARLRAAPVPAPGPAAWAGIGPRDAYRRVSAQGAFLPGRDTFVQAVTVRGPGWWAITPLRTGAGATILVNRGFVPTRAPLPPEPGARTVTGLLRLSEPRGGFLRANAPAPDRWYSRDVAAIAARRGIGPVAPYFIDADAGRAAPGAPVGGLTVVAFPNNHLIYALTWYGLAVMAMIGLVFWYRAGRRDGVR